MVADLFLLDVGVVGRERHVDDDRHLRVDAVGADDRAPAVPGDLFLGRRGGNDARRAGVLRVTAQRLEDRERADAVVDRAGDDSVVREVYRLRVDDRRVADADAPLRFRAIRRTDVDPEVGHLRGGIAV